MLQSRNGTQLTESNLETFYPTLLMLELTRKITTTKILFLMFTC